MEKDRLLNGYWKVEDNGHMKYLINDEVIFDIEPETLTSEDRLFELMCHNLINVENYAYHYIIACRKAGIPKITLRLK
ncbi:MAG TPA: hypothetical protein VK175_05470 [Leadbetterella sp.]|nr:hypothetical protein [Leadbetterella sp.]